jgi:hypothetical protein
MNETLEKVRRIFGATRDFFPLSEIKSLIAEKRHLSPSEISSAEGLMIFQTRRQITWLIFSPEWLFCVIDAVSDHRPRLLWSLNKEAIVNASGDITLSMTVLPDTENTGRLLIGEKSPRKFSLSSSFKRQLLTQYDR